MSIYKAIYKAICDWAVRCCHWMSLVGLTKTLPSHLILESPVLSELGYLCLGFLLQTTHSGNLFAAFVALLRKPMKAARNISINISEKSGGQPWRIDSVCSWDSWVWVGVRTKEQFLHDQPMVPMNPIVQNRRGTERIKTFKLLGNLRDFCKLFFLSFLEIGRSRSGVI